MDCVTNKVPCSISCCFNFGTLLGNPIILRLVKKKEKKKKSSICLRISLQNFLVNRILGHKVVHASVISALNYRDTRSG